MQGRTSVARSDSSSDGSSALAPADWQFDRETRRQQLGDAIGSWARLEATAGARVLKSNALRDVIALQATTTRPALVVKRYRTRSLAERLKSLVVPSRARREWEALETLRRAGIAAPKCLGWAEHVENGLVVEAGLAMEFVDAVPAPTFLESSGTSAEVEALRIAFLRAVGLLVGRVHAIGVDHTDLHAGNLLVRRRLYATAVTAATGPEVRPHPEPELELVILDVHSAVVGALVPERRRLAAIAQLAHSLPELFDKRGIETFLRAYAAVPMFADVCERIPELVRAIADRRTAFGRVRRSSRSKRCFKNSSEFAKFCHGRWRGHRSRDIEAADISELAHADDPFESSLQESRSYRTGRGRVGDRPVFLKERRFSLLDGLVARVRRHPLERSWGVSRALAVAEVPTPRALFVVSETRWGIVRRSIFAAVLQEDARSVDRYLAETLYPKGSNSGRGEHGRLVRIALRELAALLARVHDLGIYHHDCAPKNWLVDVDADGRPHFSLVDLDSVRHDGIRGWGYGVFGRLTSRRRHRSLVQLGYVPEGHVSVRTRLSFLREYLERRNAGLPEPFDRRLVDALSSELRKEFVKSLRTMSLHLATTGRTLGLEMFERPTSR